MAALAAVWAMAWFSARAAETALAEALDTHLRAQATLISQSLGEVPVELAVALGANSRAGVEQSLEELRLAGGLHALALLGPADAVLGSESAWLPERAESDLIAQARGAAVVTGPLYRDDAGALYLTAYAPLEGHPGWVVALEGSGATLGAVDVLERQQLLVGAVVVALTGLLGALLASVVVRPLRRLDEELGAAAPGDAPHRIGLHGPREVQAVAAAARRLLEGIRDRDAELEAAHQRELQQVARMAAEIAHEIRNPLQAMTLSATSLVDVQDPERRRRISGRLREQIRQLDAIVARLVDITRPLQPALVDLDLEPLVQELAVECGLKVASRGDGGLRLRTDRTMLAEVLRNLLLNARQAGAERVDLSVRTEGSRAILELADGGPGIPAEVVPQLFQWFHTTRAQGTGLGLPLSRRICEALGGTLELVRPAPATFRITLPWEAP